MKVFLAGLLGVIMMFFPAGKGKDYKAEFIKGAYISRDTEENCSVILKSRADMDNYINKILTESKVNNTVFPEGYLENIESQIKGVYSGYDDKFFKNNILVISLIDSGSGSYKYNVSGFSVNNGKLTVNVKRNSGLAVTMDYVHWVMMLEVNNKYNIDSVIVILDKEPTPMPLSIY